MTALPANRSPLPRSMNRPPVPPLRRPSRRFRRCRFPQRLRPPRTCHSNSRNRRRLVAKAAARASRAWRQSRARPRPGHRPELRPRSPARRPRRRPPRPRPRLHPPHSLAQPPRRRQTRPPHCSAGLSHCRLPARRSFPGSARPPSPPPARPNRTPPRRRRRNRSPPHWCRSPALRVTRST